ncbi:GNAT family N-acetyltransferase [Persicobacter sp. CCB-QB2]|uniref:GNAT family N-acetyltransferase n=1 Tax=Persicobacter sp. CCB-QB2 TaxID=1561025 RepID=UPI0006A9DB11|nr:GNAT family N-acetyltransferase [Persicobacter sp. CCB-QB2]
MPSEALESNCHFNTLHLSVHHWKELVHSPKEEEALARTIIEILSPEVTKTLPPGWQEINTLSEARNWMKERASESLFLTVHLKDSKKIIGFIFLYESSAEKKQYELRFGYLLAKEVWGKGFGTELISGLIAWCKAMGNIKSLSGGVEKSNLGSVRVMEKNGFHISESEGPTEEVVFYEYVFR